MLRSAKNLRQDWNDVKTNHAAKATAVAHQKMMKLSKLMIANRSGDTVPMSETASAENDDPTAR